MTPRVPLSDLDMRPIAGFECLYSVSRDGQVWSHANSRHQGQWITGKRHPKGYIYAHLWKDGKSYPRKVHRLVASAFIPNPDGLPQVNHIDGDKGNNAATNLEWCDNRRNSEHAIENGLFKPAISAATLAASRKHARSIRKLTLAQAEEVRRRNAAGESQKSLGREFGVSHVAIRQILIGMTYAN